MAIEQTSAMQKLALPKKSIHRPPPATALSSSSNLKTEQDDFGLQQVMQGDPEKTYVNRKIAGKIVGMKPETLATWAHHQRYDLPFYRVGNRRVLYKLADLLAFINKGAQ